MPSGPGVIDESMIAEIAGSVPPGIETFLLTSQTRPETIEQQYLETGVTTLQLVDWIGVESLRKLRKRCPGARLVQVLHVESNTQLDQAQTIEGDVDAILLDSGRPSAEVKELGGTGRTHNWSISRKIREVVSVPVYLAGGLKAGNVSAAVQSVDPYGVDLCSGVRTEGMLDSNKLDRFFRDLSTYRESRPS